VWTVVHVSWVVFSQWCNGGGGFDVALAFLFSRCAWGFSERALLFASVMHAFVVVCGMELNCLAVGTPWGKCVFEME